jgi:hypothetical protein
MLRLCVPNDRADDSGDVAVVLGEVGPKRIDFVVVAFDARDRKTLELLEGAVELRPLGIGHAFTVMKGASAAGKSRPSGGIQVLFGRAFSPWAVRTVRADRTLTRPQRASTQCFDLCD